MNFEKAASQRFICAANPRFAVMAEVTVCASRGMSLRNLGIYGIKIAVMLLESFGLEIPYSSPRDVGKAGQRVAAMPWDWRGQAAQALRAGLQG